ncbi:MAG: response regulator [Calditrichaeota bacterium]|nr:MAG: response regulator [Calditrichota bacterium]
MARILVVDDDAQIRLMLERMLSRHGFEVLVAEDGAEALKTAIQNPVDVILMDIIMPEKEGIETIVEMRKKFPRVKIIAMSGGSPYLGADTNLTIARRVGADQILRKPFQQVELLGAIREVLQDS